MFISFIKIIWRSEPKSDEKWIWMHQSYVALLIFGNRKFWHWKLNNVRVCVVIRLCAFESVLRHMDSVSFVSCNICFIFQYLYGWQNIVQQNNVEASTIGSQLKCFTVNCCWMCAFSCTKTKIGNSFFFKRVKCEKIFPVNQKQYYFSFKLLYTFPDWFVWWKSVFQQCWKSRPQFNMLLKV